MINQKITHIANLITPCDVVMDIGCDHCYLAIELLSSHKAQTIINIDVRKDPLAIGMKNLKKHQLLEHTINLVNDGLKDLTLAHPQFKNINKIDYCVIAGMGANNIIDILKNNSLPIDNFILHPTKNEYQLRSFLIKNGYEIMQEHYVYERNIFYPLFVVNKTNKKIQYHEEELYFGKINNIDNPSIYLQMLVARKKFLETNYDGKWTLVNKKLYEEYQLLLKRMKYYEDK